METSAPAMQLAAGLERYNSGQSARDDRMSLGCAQCITSRDISRE